MPDPTIRHAFVGVLVKLETTEGVDASPAGIDAIPVEADSVTWNSPFREEDSTQATGSLVGGAPLIVGQAATVGFSSRLKGLNAVYTSSARPPLHAALSACGKRGLFTAAVAATALAAGGATGGTLQAPYAATAQLYRGAPLALAVNPAGGYLAYVTAYTAGRVATLADTFSPVLDTSTTAAVPAHWTYAGTSPADLAARATDHPSATIYVYIDGVLRRFTGCRGTVEASGGSARPGIGAFSFTGIYAGRVDAATPALTVAGHSAPLLLQGAAAAPAFSINRKPLPIATWTVSDAGAIESPDDPNTANGFGPGVIGARRPVLSCDPLETLVATRDLLAEIGAGTNYPGVIRMGAVANNRVAIVMPQLQPVAADPGKRGQLASESTRFRLLSPGVDSAGRDGDWLLVFS